jgi:hypothetical protein
MNDANQTFTPSDFEITADGRVKIKAQALAERLQALVEKAKQTAGEQASVPLNSKIRIDV